MRRKNDFCALFDGVVYRRQRACDARVVFNRAVFYRHIKIDTNKNSFAFNINVFYRFFVHICC